MYKSNISPDNIKCYLLNYDGGFVRRGLLGELILWLSSVFKLNISTIFLCIYLIIYTLFFYFFYRLTKNFRQNILFYFFLFSPLNFIFLLVQLDYGLPNFLGEKEIFIISFFLYSCKLVNEQNINRTKFFIIHIIGLSILCFLYELTFFVLPFFILNYYLFLKKNQQNIIYSEIIIFILNFGIILFIHLILYGKYNFDVFFTNLELNHGIISNLNDHSCIYNWMNKKITSQIVFLFDEFKITYFLKYLFYCHPIFLLIFFSIKKSKEKLEILLLVLSTLSVMSLFLIAIDWARWVHIIYLLVLFSTLQLFDFKKNLFLDMFNYLNLKKINKNVLVICTVIYCTMWTLKHTYWQNHLSYALIKIIKYNIESVQNF